MVLGHTHIIKLSERLKAVAAFVPNGAEVADVGTDHGYIPIWLIQTGTSNRVIASDINEGPLKSAKLSAASYGITGIDFRLCGGLSGINSDEADTVIIAGMGGETIAEIITESSWDWNGKRLILQPMSKQAELIYMLYDKGFSVENESFAFEKNEIYRILKVAYKTAEAPRKAFVYGGFTYGGYTEKQKGKLIRALKGLYGASERENEKINEYKSILEDMEDAYCKRDI